MGYALLIELRGRSSLIQELRSGSRGCVIVGAKIALEPQIFTCLLRYLAMQLGTGEWTALLPANSPWTTVNQLLLGGHSPLRRCRRTVCYVPSSWNVRSAFRPKRSVQMESSVFLPVVVIQVRCPLEDAMQNHDGSWLRWQPTYGAASAGWRYQLVLIIWLLRAIAQPSSKPRCIKEVWHFWLHIHWEHMYFN